MTPASQQITQAGERRDSRLESLRALAALGVMVGHIWGQSRQYVPSQTMGTFWQRLTFSGGLGNMLFFALSGYLIFWPFARRYFSTAGPVDLRRYGVNRFLRIAPLYFVCLVVVIILVDHGGRWDTWWRFLTMSENFSTHTLGKVDGPMWAVTVDVMFYLLLPLLAFALGKLSRGSRLRAAILLILLGFGSWLLARHAVAGNVRRPMLQYSLPGSFLYYVPGMLLVLLRLHWREHKPSWLRGPLASSDVWLLTAMAFFLFQVSNYSSLVLVSFAVFLALGACVLPLRPGHLTRALQWRPLAAFGVMSYSLAMWHNPIVIWLSGLHGIPHSFHGQLLIAGAVSVAAAVVSYHVIEAPFLKLRRPWSSAAAASSTATPAGSEPSSPGAMPSRLTPELHVSQ